VGGTSNSRPPRRGLKPWRRRKLSPRSASVAGSDLAPRLKPESSPLPPRLETSTRAVPVLGDGGVDGTKDDEIRGKFDATGGIDGSEGEVGDGAVARMVGRDGEVERAGDFLVKPEVPSGARDVRSKRVTLGAGEGSGHDEGETEEAENERHGREEKQKARAGPRNTRTTRKGDEKRGINSEARNPGKGRGWFLDSWFLNSSAALLGGEALAEVFELVGLGEVVEVGEVGVRREAGAEVGESAAECGEFAAVGGGEEGGEVLGGGAGDRDGLGAGPGELEVEGELGDEVGLAEGFRQKLVAAGGEGVVAVEGEDEGGHGDQLEIRAAGRARSFWPR